MCELIRRHQPQATVVVGGHIANVPDLRRASRRRPRRQGRGCRLVPALPRRRSDSALPSSDHRLRVQDALARHRREPEARGHGGHHHPVGRLSARLQLLLHLGHVRRARASSSPSTSTATSSSTSWPGRGQVGRPFVLRHGRELPAPPAAGDAPPGTDEGPRQELVALRLQLGERAAAVHHGRARRAGRLVGLDRPRGVGERLPEAQGHRHLRSRAQPPDPRHPRPRLEHHRPARAYGRDHRRGHRPRGGPRHRVPPVHALHAGAGHAAVEQARRRGQPPAARRRCPSRMPTGSSASTTATPTSARRGDRGPAAGLPPRLRGQRAEHRAHHPDAAPGLAAG